MKLRDYHDARKCWIISIWSGGLCSSGRPEATESQARADQPFRVPMVLLHVCSGRPDKWTIRELAEELGLPQPTLCNWVQSGRLTSRSEKAGAGSAKVVTVDAATIDKVKTIGERRHLGADCPATEEYHHSTLDS